ncbi:hypothetical protein N866_04980 [Actinotalea ferrariae CF5-4]|uniref:Uncharacterized protein n=1 Tax=Actinotalea ferrariae CF5-4 TaxID=948458 RepID=A0A021VUQ5_9CELL|nr:hypothetical protein [Actinotalea ferrariae]EYR62817.1 hypothetical protein N866_04980 [Actinotalea ferrariae CF5-4]
MARLFWVAVGAAGAVVVARRLQETARRYTPAGVAERVEVAGERTTEAVGSALERFRTARAEREQELLTTLLVTPEDGDPHAVLGRSRRERDAWGAATSSSGGSGRRGTAAGRDVATGGARPSGRVDDSEPLYEF